MKKISSINKNLFLIKKRTSPINLKTASMLCANMRKKKHLVNAWSLATPCDFRKLVIFRT